MNGNGRIALPGQVKIGLMHQPADNAQTVVLPAPIQGPEGPMVFAFGGLSIREELAARFLAAKITGGMFPAERADEIGRAFEMADNFLALSRPAVSNG